MVLLITPEFMLSIKYYTLWQKEHNLNKIKIKILKDVALQIYMRTKEYGILKC